MSWVFATTIGAAVGVVAGAIAERLPIAPLLQTLGASAGALVLSPVLLVVVWSRLPAQSGSGGIGAVSAGISELVVFAIVPALFVVFAGLHVALGRLGTSSPWIAHHRAIILASIAGVCGGLPVAWLMSLMGPTID
jgi:hypothetical protein